MKSQVVFVYLALLVAIPLIVLSSSHQVWAAAEVAFDPSVPTNANPDGSFNVGTPVYVVATLDSGCTSAQIDWGDGSSSTGSSGTGVVHFSHEYSSAGVYEVYATDMCDGQSVNYLDVTVVGGGFPINFGSASFPVSLTGLMAGLLVMTWANPRSKAVVGKKGAAALAALRQSKAPAQGPVGNYRRPTGYTTAQPNPPTTQGGGLPSPIAGGTGYSVDTGKYVGPVPSPQGQLITGVGASVSVPEGPLAFLNAIWGRGNVILQWGPPEFDPNNETLIGYEVSQVTFGPNSTAPVETVVAPMQPPGASQINLPYNQTYQFNSGGDLAGFRVDPVFVQNSSGTQVIGRSQGLFVKFGQNIGTPGL